jgi:hypothetical protein
MSPYEITFIYPDQPLDRSTRAFLGSIIATPNPTLDGFRFCEGGVALTFVVDQAADGDTAYRIANQRAGGIWPNLHPERTEVKSLTPDAAP